MQVILKQTIEAYEITKVDGCEIQYKDGNMSGLSSFQPGFIEFYQPKVGDYLIQEYPTKRWRVEQKGMYQVLYVSIGTAPAIKLNRNFDDEEETRAEKELTLSPEEAIRCGDADEPCDAYKQLNEAVWKAPREIGGGRRVKASPVACFKDDTVAILGSGREVDTKGYFAIGGSRASRAVEHGDMCVSTYAGRMIFVIKQAFNEDFTFDRPASVEDDAVEPDTLREGLGMPPIDDADVGRVVVPIGSFGFTIRELLMGNKMYRKGWNGKDMWIELQVPDDHSKMTQPYIYINTPQMLIPWLASQSDMLANDWYVFID